MSDLYPGARVTRHAAAPMKHTVTALPGGVSLRPVTPPTAHEVTSVQADRGRVTLAPLSPLVANGIVCLAKFRGLFKVHQIVLVWGFVVGVHGYQVWLVSDSRTASIPWRYKNTKI